MAAAMLHVTVHGCRNLKKPLEGVREIWGCVFLTQDGGQYVKNAKYETRSTTVSDGADPMWNDCFDFQVDSGVTEVCARIHARFGLLGAMGVAMGVTSKQTIGFWKMPMAEALRVAEESNALARKQMLEKNPSVTEVQFDDLLHNLMPRWYKMVDDAGEICVSLNLTEITFKSAKSFENLSSKNKARTQRLQSLFSSVYENEYVLEKFKGAIETITRTGSIYITPKHLFFHSLSDKIVVRIDELIGLELIPKTTSPFLPCRLKLYLRNGSDYELLNLMPRKRAKLVATLYTLSPFLMKGMFENPNMFDSSLSLGAEDHHDNNNAIDSLDEPDDDVQPTDIAKVAKRRVHSHTGLRQKIDPSELMNLPGSSPPTEVTTLSSTVVKSSPGQSTPEISIPLLQSDGSQPRSSAAQKSDSEPLMDSNSSSGAYLTPRRSLPGDSFFKMLGKVQKDFKKMGQATQVVLKVPRKMSQGILDIGRRKSSVEHSTKTSFHENDPHPEQQEITISHSSYDKLRDSHSTHDECDCQTEDFDSDDDTSDDSDFDVTEFKEFPEPDPIPDDNGYQAEDSLDVQNSRDEGQKTARTSKAEITIDSVELPKFKEKLEELPSPQLNRLLSQSPDFTEDYPEDLPENAFLSSGSESDSETRTVKGRAASEGYDSDSSDPELYTDGTERGRSRYRWGEEPAPRSPKKHDLDRSTVTTNVKSIPTQSSFLKSKPQPSTFATPYLEYVKLAIALFLVSMFLPPHPSIFITQILALEAFSRTHYYDLLQRVLLVAGLVVLQAAVRSLPTLQRKSKYRVARIFPKKPSRLKASSIAILWLFVVVCLVLTHKLSLALSGLQQQSSGPLLNGLYLLGGHPILDMEFLRLVTWDQVFWGALTTFAAVFVQVHFW